MNISKMKIVIILIVNLAVVFSCRNKDIVENLNRDGQTTVRVSVEDDIFDDMSSIGSKASLKTSGSKISQTVQKSTVAFNDDYYLVAELKEDVSAKSQKIVKASLQKSKIAEASSLSHNIRYKIVVFKSSGEYVTEKNYIRGQETSEGPLLLHKGNYTFIAYSINSMSELPAISFEGLDGKKTLLNARLEVSGNVDFMYFRKDVNISGLATNYLGVILKHKFSKITVTIDASATGYNITAIKSAINPGAQNNNGGSFTAFIELSGGTIYNRTGVPLFTDVPFPVVGMQKVTSSPTVLNVNATRTGIYTIALLTIGNVTKGDITAFRDLVITPGVKYNMTVKIVPTDGYVTYLGGIAGVRINGKIWMRHNLGADLESDPDVLTAAIHGNYYEWGQNKSIGNGTSKAYPIMDWNINKQLKNTWNDAEKGINDPCPNGFRVPTREEFEDLIDNVSFSDIGISKNSSDNYSYAKILTSIRNKNVKMTLPAQGFYSYTIDPNSGHTNQIQARGEIGAYWSSSYGSRFISAFHFFKNFNNLREFEDYSYHIENQPQYARSVRCIAKNN